jgi:hypothetical protein
LQKTGDSLPSAIPPFFGSGMPESMAKPDK